MKKTLFILLTLVIAACAKQPNTKITNFLKANVTQKDSVLSLNRFNAFEWDTLYIVPPYTNADREEGEWTKASAELSDTGIRSRDDISVLLFFNKGELAGYTEVKNAIYFADLGRANDGTMITYKRKDCVFAYKQIGPGWFEFKKSDQINVLKK
ncbi:hypothetical protein [Mucilaginibacter myungsuensis]|uniref:Lipoprotein n=1 Tax=Mucilaginibacter myungsuensis TaxID=649104 RepID=A0A929KVY6_9SPHI|nr:hypothetical protein [Mucilaginibacter myungsuensis]MBE9661712.1 hypothetical protein [Mucilaginibacter myungsuensis]MDN3597855.1 hypothetical protein [Mucilaginibacter myungsuensis]